MTRARKRAAPTPAVLPRLIFTIPGRPIPLERARVERFTVPSGQTITKTRTPNRSKAYRGLVQLHMNQAWAAMRKCWPWQTTYPVTLSLWIYWEDLNHGDGSNVLKAIEDAGNALLWADDKQIDEGHFWSALDRDYPRVEVVAELRGERP